MPRPRLLWQLFPSYFALSLLAIFATVLVTTGLWRSFMREVVQSELALRGRWVQTRLAELPSGSAPETFARFARDYSRLAESRITLIQPDGEVLADSQADGEDLVNHGDRPEVQAAWSGLIGVSRRFSDTLQKNMLYLALPPAPAPAPRLVVRLAVPQVRFEHLLFPAYAQLALAVLLLALAAAGVSYWVAARLNRPLVEMGKAAKCFASGDFSHPLWVRAPAEVADLAEGMNQMARQLDDRIRLVTRQQEQQQAVFSSLLEGVLYLDAGGRILEMNRFAAELFGAPAEQAVGRSLPEIARHPELQAFASRALAGGAEPLEAELVWYAGQARHFQATGIPLKDRGLVLVLNDITRRRQLDQIRRDFVANVSHELKTPITLIQGFVETLQDGALENREEARRFLGIIAQHAKRLDAIIEDLLALSRLEQAKAAEVPLAAEPVARIADQAVATCQAKAGAKNITLVNDCPPALTARVNANLLEQALVNLIDNALKFSEPKTTVRVAAEADSQEVRIAVSDQGCGIAPEEQERIFERFYRVDKSRSRQEGGTGLGLSIVKHILQVHGGRVSLTSAPGAGSTFALHFPAASAPEA